MRVEFFEGALDSQTLNLAKTVGLVSPERAESLRHAALVSPAWGLNALRFRVLQ